MTNSGLIPFSRGSFMIDAVSLAMLLVLPVLTWSVYQVRKYKNYALHGKIQLALGAVLAVAILSFEIDIRLNGWQHRAKSSPYFDTWVFPALAIHLFFAIPTVVLWIYVLYQALKKFDTPQAGSAYGPTHRKLGFLALIYMYATAITGWIFHWLAFVS